MNHHRTLIAAVPLAVLLAALTGCSSSSQLDADAPSTAASDEATLAATDDSTAAVVESPVETPAGPVADEWSQIIDGVLYLGSEAAPVRIGTDTPGQPPAIEAQMIVSDGKSENAKQLAIDNNKYVVLVWNSPSEGGYVWKIRGMSQHGSFRDLADSFALPAYASADEAIAAGFTIDGRTLDRAEYLLLAR